MSYFACVILSSNIFSPEEAHELSFFVVDQLSG